jgi:hypothetical protein
MNSDGGIAVSEKRPPPSSFFIIQTGKTTPGESTSCGFST